MAIKIEATAAILCHSSIMKSAIASSLKNFGISCTDDSDEADVAIVVSGMLPQMEREGAQEKCPIETTKARRWVVLSRGENDPVCRKILEKGEEPCRVPDDIDGNDLGHVVRLAVNGHVLKMGHFCRENYPQGPQILEDAGLDEQQWQLLIHLSNGLSNKEIANLEGSSESAIKARLRGLLQKLNMNNRTKAAVLAAKCGIGNNYLEAAE